MAKGSSAKSNSVAFWMFTTFITALPCIGLIVILVWAYSDRNDERRNYCRAILGWYLVFAFVWLGMLALGTAPATAAWIQGIIEKLRAYL